MDKSQKAQSPFNLSDTSYDEYRNQKVVETGDGGFFDALDEMFDVIKNRPSFRRRGKTSVMSGNGKPNETIDNQVHKGMGPCTQRA